MWLWSSHSTILGISTGLSQIETKSIRFSKRQLQCLTGEGEIQETLHQWAWKQTQMISAMFYRCICYLIMCKSTCAPPYEQGYFELHSCLIKRDGLLSFHKQPVPCSVVPIRAFKFNHARLHPAIGSHNTCKYNLPDKSRRAMKHLFFLMHLPPSFSDVPYSYRAHVWKTMIIQPWKEPDPGEDGKCPSPSSHNHETV